MEATGRNPAKPIITDDFPPHAWLGWSLDMTSVTPADITSVANSVLKTSQLIQISKNSHQQSFGSAGITWDVPDNVNATDQVQDGEASYHLYEDGMSASSEITANASVSASYMAVSGSISANYSIAKMFQASYSYALFSYNATAIHVSVEGWGDQINEDGLKRRLKNLPKWVEDVPDTIGKYRRFFRTEGTHVITGATYGSKFQLNAWSSNSKTEQKQEFGANVSVEYNGLTTSGKFDASISKKDEFSEFKRSIQKQVSCQGGDPAIAGEIASSVEKPDIYKDYNSWVESSRKNPGIMSMETVAIWDLMSAAADETIVNRASEVENAYKYITSNPAQHVTQCRFVVNSDWAEIGLLTPSAFIKPSPSSPAASDFTLSETKISWGREHSRDFQREVTVDFEIHNDGSPVDIMLSHGSDGSTGGSGACSVIIHKTNYDNTGIQDNNWNSRWFYQCGVNPNEAA